MLICTAGGREGGRERKGNGASVECPTGVVLCYNGAVIQDLTVPSLHIPGDPIRDIQINACKQIGSNLFLRLQLCLSGLSYGTY